MQKSDEQIIDDIFRELYPEIEELEEIQDQFEQLRNKTQNELSAEDVEDIQHEIILLKQKLDTLENENITNHINELEHEIDNFKIMPEQEQEPDWKNDPDYNQVQIIGESRTIRIDMGPNDKGLLTEDYLRQKFPDANRYYYTFIIADDTGRTQFVTPREKQSYTPKHANDFFYGVITQFYQAKYVWLQIYPRNSEPQDFTLFENATTNCVIETIKGRFPKKATVLDQYAKLNNFDGTKPMTKQESTKLARKFKLKLIFHSQVGIWYTTGCEKHTEVNIYAHNDHASKYIPVTKIDTPIIVNNVQDAIKDLHQPLKLKMNVRCINGAVQYDTESARAGSKIYKTYQTPEPENPDYFHCTTEISYAYAKWYKDNNLRPLCDEYYTITKAADHHLTTQQFQDINQKKYHNYDMNKAFPSFKQSKYYEKYQLALGFVTLYNNTDPVHINRPGFSRITNIKYNNEIIQETKWIQDNNWYTHIRLNYILENNLASFDVTQTIIAKSEDIEFPFKPFDNIPEHKRFNNAFIGMLIAGGHDQTKFAYYTTTSANELAQLQFELNQNPDTIAITPVQGDLLCHEYRSTQKSLFHIHAQIIDYQQVSFMEKMCRVKKSELVAFFTDGFYTTEKQNIVFSTRAHEFKYSFDTIKTQSKYEPTIHEPIIEFNAPDINKHLNRLNHFNATIGPPGSGKTFIAIESHPRICRVVLAPNHKLKASMKSKVTDQVQTYHKFFGIGSKYHIQTVKEQIDIDEITMCTDEHLKKIIDTCTKYRMCLSIYGDFEVNNGQVKIFQRPPCSKAGEPIEYETIKDFTITKEVGPIRRQNTTDAAFLDSLRGLSHSEMVTKLKTRCRVVSEVNPNIIGISSMHLRCHKFNKNTYDSIKATVKDMPYNQIAVRARCVKKSADYFKGQTVMMMENFVWMDRTSSSQESKYQFEISYFNTVDAVQGDTIEHEYYVDLHRSDMENALYTAVTRCRNLDDVILIDV